MTIAVGIDGCKAGWFYFCCDANSISHGVVSHIDKLLHSLPNHARVCIDIPIGLIESGAAGRCCDVGARKLLGGKRASSVFAAPCRPVLQAKSYEHAKQISLNAIGKKLSKQTFNITAKIKQVDDFMLSHEQNISIREVHPELCFWALNGRNALMSRKKDKVGIEERVRLLSKYLPNIHDWVAEILSTYLRKDVAPDDVLDAIVAMLIARTSDDALQSVPEIPPTDARGLAMEIVFTEHPNDRAL